MAYRLLVLNPGSTSTKAAIYEDEHQLAVKSMVHTNQDLAPYPTLYDQLDYRVALVRLWLAQEGFDLSTLSAVVGRGGIIPHIVAGGYQVDDALEDCLRHHTAFDHASNLGGLMHGPLLNPWGFLRISTMQSPATNCCLRPVSPALRRSPVPASATCSTLGLPPTSTRRRWDVSMRT